MSLVLNESLVLAKTRSQDLKSVLRLNCWGSGIADVSLVRDLINVEVIGLSCNEITTLEDFAYCHKLKELILRKNRIKNIAEIAHLQGLPKLRNLWLGDNPCAENTHNYRKVVLKALPQLEVLDNVPVTKEEIQEIEELGNDIYEEVPYESSHSSGSGPSVASMKHQPGAEQYEPTANGDHTAVTSQDITSVPYSHNDQQHTNETSIYQPQNEPQDISMASTTVGQHSQLNDSHFNNSSMINKMPARMSNIHSQPSRCISSQGSVTALNGSQHQGWSLSHSNNNNTILPKGGKSRNGNILSAVLCLVKELDYVSCEVVQTALHCRMEETSQ